MFSGGVDVVLEYRIASAIINYSLSKRTMKVANSRSPVICQSAVCSNFDTCTGSHRLWSTMMVFLGNLDFSNGEGGSTIDGWWNTERRMLCHISAAEFKGGAA